MLCNDVNTTFNRGATIVLLIVAAIEIMVLGKDVRSSEEPFAPTLRLNAEGRKRIRMALGAAAAFLAFEAGVHLLVRNWF